MFATFAQSDVLVVSDCLSHITGAERLLVVALLLALHVLRIGYARACLHLMQCSTADWTMVN